MPGEGPLAGVDTREPSIARVYDYFLGGKDHFAVDREQGDRIIAELPQVREWARQNRAFLSRAVQYLAEEVGVVQFIDLGSGLPTAANVHQVAQQCRPDARVVYVDYDPVVVTHGRALLADKHTAILHADLRDPEDIWASPQVTGLIDLTEPVAVLFVAVLHFITDAEDPPGIIRGYTDRLAPGSHLVISHAEQTEETAAAAREYQAARTALRTAEQIGQLFTAAAFEPIPPGVVPVTDWRPPQPRSSGGEHVAFLAGVGENGSLQASGSHSSAAEAVCQGGLRVSDALPQAPARPSEHDPSRPQSARVWNYWLGGKDNYLVGDLIRRLIPDIADTARHDRAFLGRAVRYLAGAVGIRQFLDIGTGLPAVDNTHQVAQRAAPECRIVYVDNDPLVLAHARALLTSTPEGACALLTSTSEGACAYIDADLREPDTILAEAAKTLDLSQPVALMLLLGILHHIPEYDHARAIVRRLLADLPPGSFLAVAHATAHIHGPLMHEAMQRFMDLGGALIVARTPQQITGFFHGLQLLEPGVVSCSRWRLEPTALPAPPELSQFCGVARKPAARDGKGGGPVTSTLRGADRNQKPGPSSGAPSRALGRGRLSDGAPGSVPRARWQRPGPQRHRSAAAAPAVAPAVAPARGHPTMMISTPPQPGPHDGRPMKIQWRKSSRSGTFGGDPECVELADLGGAVGIRDSKDPDGPVLRFSIAEIRDAFTTMKASS